MEVRGFAAWPYVDYSIISSRNRPRQNGNILQCLHGNLMAKNALQNRNFRNLWIARLKYQVEESHMGTWACAVCVFCARVFLVFKMAASTSTKWRVDSTRRQVERTTRRDETTSPGEEMISSHELRGRHDGTMSRHDEMTSWRDEMTSRHDEMTSQRNEMTCRRDEMNSRHDEMTSWSDETMRWTFCPRFDVIQLTLEGLNPPLVKTRLTCQLTLDGYLCPSSVESLSRQLVPIVCRPWNCVWRARASSMHLLSPAVGSISAALSCLVYPPWEETAARVSGKPCLWRQFLIKILAVPLVVTNVIWWQSSVGSRDAHGS